MWTRQLSSIFCDLGSIPALLADESSLVPDHIGRTRIERPRTAAGLENSAAASFLCVHVADEMLRAYSGLS